LGLKNTLDIVIFEKPGPVPGFWDLGRILGLWFRKTTGRSKNAYA